MNTSTIETPEKKEETTEKTTEETTEEVPESNFKDKKHYPIFPTNLFEFVFKEKEAAKVRACLPALHKMVETDEPNWVTRPDLNTLDGFEDSEARFAEGAEEVLGFSGVLFDDMLITSLKASRYTEPRLTSMEIRPNNLLSGLFVLKTDGAGRVTFFDPRPQAWIVKPPISQAHIFNSDAFSVEFKLNKLFIFPAWLQYQVAFKEDKEKKMGENIYVTWNAMVRGGSKPEGG